MGADKPEIHRQLGSWKLRQSLYVAIFKQFLLPQETSVSVVQDLQPIA